MPMDINKIIHCEKRNELRINVYGLEGKTYEIIPLCVSSNWNYYRIPTHSTIILCNKPEGTNGHYCYIKDFSSLTSNQSSSKKILIKKSRTSLLL